MTNNRKKVETNSKFVPLDGWIGIILDCVCPWLLPPNHMRRGGIVAYGSTSYPSNIKYDLL